MSDKVFTPKELAEGNTEEKGELDSAAFEQVAISTRAHSLFLSSSSFGRSRGKSICACSLRWLRLVSQLTRRQDVTSFLGEHPVCLATSALLDWEAHSVSGRQEDPAEVRLVVIELSIEADLEQGRAARTAPVHRASAICSKYGAHARTDAFWKFHSKKVLTKTAAPVRWLSCFSGRHSHPIDGRRHSCAHSPRLHAVF